MNYRGNIWKLYIIRFFHSLIPAYVIERLFNTERGISIQMIVYLEIIYAMTVVLFEIPTGIISDRWSRKRMMVISASLCSIEFLILIFAWNFWQFALVSFLAGLGRSASSGTENALIYDSLVMDGNEITFERVLGRINAFGFTAAMIAALSGSVFASKFGLTFNYWISLISTSAAISFSLVLVEPNFRSTSEVQLKVFEYITKSIQFFKQNSSVCQVVFTGMIIGASLNYLDEFWQTYLCELSIPVVYFGLFSAGFLVLRLPGNIIAYILIRYFKHRTLFIGVIIIFTLGFLCVSMFKGFIGILAMLVISTASGIMEPIVSGYLHKRVESEMRATVDSFQSLGLRGVITIVGLGFGYFSTRFTIFKGYGFIGVLCLIYLIYFFVMAKKIE